jgi:preprotein translocase subunit SecA
MNLISKIFGDPNAKHIAKLRLIVEQINNLEKDLEKLSAQELKNKTQDLVARRKKNELLDTLLPEAFALIREAAKRTIGQRHFDVQILGGLVLAQGGIAEMKTGEGKTLVATLPLFWAALEKRGANLITVNDYLARRDAEWMGQIYNFLGLSVGVLNHEKSYLYQAKPEGRTTYLGSGEELQEVNRQQAYAADITYGTNNEYGFDYLRDNMAHDFREIVQRDHFYAIVDEVDSILIDEARTPLIISAPADESADLYYQLARLVEKLKLETDYKIDEKMKTTILTEEGQERIVELLHEDPWEMSSSLNDLEKRAKGIQLEHHINAALRAMGNFTRDKDYVVREGEIIIVDEFTGRLMNGRRYSEGLHQAIEAKESVEVKKESKTLATITFQNYFKMYEKLAGMTGTAETEAEEFYKIYNLETTVIPTNKPLQRKDLADKIYATEKAKFDAVVEEVRRIYIKGQPILIGTTSIEKNEFLSKLLKKAGVPHETLNAKQHEREAQIFAQAGKFKAVTCATNMAGRGVDIILGGSPLNEEERKKVIELGGLHVLGTERHEARRIDNQLRGRAGRQGDPGSSQFFVSTEDELMRIFGGDRIKNLMQTFRFPDGMPIENKIISHSIESSQKRIEGYNFDIRKHLLDYDNVLSKHREAVYRLREDILKTIDKEKIKEIIFKMVEEEIDQILISHTTHDAERNWDLNKIGETCSAIFNLPLNWQEEFSKIRKEAGTREQDVHARTDLFNYIFDLAKKSFLELEKKNELELFYRIVKFLILRTVDNFWIWHLEAMENLKGGIGLRAYGQRDPLVEYKKESYYKYHQLLEEIRKSIVNAVFKISIQQSSVAEAMEDEGKKPKEIKLAGPAKEGDAGGVQEFDEKVGRNDPCPCGAKKSDGTPIKYKHCCGK